MKVKAKAKSERVVLWEKDKTHPGGEVYITGNGATHKVALTPAVKSLLERGILVEVVEDKVPELRPATEEEEKKAVPPLTESVEKATAEVPVTGGIRKGGRPPKRGK